MVYSNFYVTLWYTPLSERESVRPARFLLQSPSYKLYTLIGNPLKSDGVSQEPIDYKLLEHCVVGFENVEGLTAVHELPLEVQQDLIKKIVELYYPDEEFYKRLITSLDIFLDPKVSNETWTCEVCQKRRLDRQRNCPYLDPVEYHDPRYSLAIGDEVYTTCPIPQKDTELVGKSMEAYRLMDAGYLPEAGAFGDQIVFWAVAGQKMKEKINFYERKQMEEERAKLKR